jgi:hypothetical protein
MHDGEEEKM